MIATPIVFLADSKTPNLPSRNRYGIRRTRERLLKGRFKIDKIRRVEMKPFKDASGLKALDFSEITIKELIVQGYDAALDGWSAWMQDNSDNP
jgi:hypothetical protein